MVALGNGRQSTCDFSIVSSPDPTLCEEKGLAHFEQFLVFSADSACHVNL